MSEQKMERISSYQTKFPKACECLEKDKEVLFTFYDFPAQQEGARKLLEAAIENEVIDYIQFHKDRRDENGQRLVESKHRR